MEFTFESCFYWFSRVSARSLSQFAYSLLSNGDRYGAEKVEVLWEVDVILVNSLLLPIFNSSSFVIEAMFYFILYWFSQRMCSFSQSLLISLRFTDFLSPTKLRGHPLKISQALLISFQREVFLSCIFFREFLFPCFQFIRFYELIAGRNVWTGNFKEGKSHSRYVDIQRKVVVSWLS